MNYHLQYQALPGNGYENHSLYAPLIRCRNLNNILLVQIHNAIWETSLYFIVLRLTVPTTHWSYDPLFRGSISPTAHWSYYPLVLSLIGPKTHWFYVSLVLLFINILPCIFWSYDSLILQLAGPTTHWSYVSLILHIGAQMLYGPLVLRPNCPTTR